jgi:ubiquinone/menaquinone biosynthesis C-methylase UbiE/uncharacterized protein YbaR (Trm112 family)
LVVVESDSIFCCPICKLPLARMSHDELECFQQTFASGELHHIDGERVRLPMADAYVCHREGLAYGVHEGVVLLLKESAIALSVKTPLRLREARSGATRKRVQQFYDEFGWTKIGDTFSDSLIFEDLRPISFGYRERTYQRIRTRLSTKGTYLLDAASGPLPHPEMSVYSKGFDYHVCLDFSFRALREARRKLGDSGIYILGDVTDIPLVDGSMDSIVSLHTLYHVPADEQSEVLREMYRVLKPKGAAVIVYSWGRRSVAMFPFSLASAVIDRLLAALRLKSGQGRKSYRRLYFHSHSYSWFAKQLRGVNLYQLACWRSVDTRFLRKCIKPSLFGQQLLSGILWLEEKFPRLFGRLGQYPMFIIHK